MPSPFISVCIPAYQRTEYLKRLLDSIKAQTYKNYEVIISDDTPDDSVQDMVRKISSLPITYFKNMVASGTPQNWNLSISRAAGDWIKIMHDDDWLAQPDSLQKFADCAMESKGSFIFSASRNIETDGRFSLTQMNKKSREALEKDKFFLLYNNVIGHPSTIMHRKWDKLKYNTSFKWVVDIDYYIRYLKTHPVFEYLDTPLINIGIGSSQVSNDCYKNPDVEIKEYFDLIQQFENEKTRRNRYVFYCLWNLAKKFRLRSIKDVLPYFQGEIPPLLNHVIYFQKKIPRIILKQTPWSEFLMRKSFARLP